MGSWSNDSPRNLKVPPGAGPNDPHIIIGPDVPAVINAYYAANYSYDPAVAWIGEYLNADHYRYQAVFTNGINFFGQANGWVDTGSVKHEYFTEHLSGLWTDIVYGDVLNQAAMRFFNSRLVIGNAAQPNDTFTDLQFWAASASRGVINGTIATSTVTVPTVAGAELDLPQLAMPATPFLVARQYELFAKLQMTKTVATDTVELRFRRDTALTGTIMGSPRFASGTALAAFPNEGHCPFTALADETVDVFVSILRLTGTGTVTFIPRLAGGNGQLSSFSRVSDAGGAPAWLNAPSWRFTA